jgi:hypothetical protein
MNRLSGSVPLNGLVRADHAIADAIEAKRFADDLRRRKRGVGGICDALEGLA